VRILLASPSLQGGGAERLVLVLADGLLRRGHAVAVSGAGGVLERELPAGVARCRLEERGRSVAGAARSAGRLAAFAGRFRPDVAHAHNPKATAVAAAALRLAGAPRAPLLATFHGVASEDHRAGARLLRAADRVVCVSAELHHGLLAAGLPAERLAVIRNGVDPAPELPPGRRRALDAELGLAGRPVVATVGRLVPQKAHTRFIDAVGRVRGSVPDLRAVIVGDGPLRGELERRTAAAGLAGAVVFAGFRADARDIMARADVVAFSSDWEGLPLAALEALAAGTPVVSTRVEGMPELLAGGAGRIVGHDAGELAAAMTALLTDGATRASMGAAGRRLVTTAYSSTAMVGAYEAAYARMVGGDPARATG
jgi:glycosyltransferase involved in cell wall biosynthesis